MKKLLSLLSIAITLSVGLAHAADAPAGVTAQQGKMGACNKEAGEKKLKGDERKAFMKSCLSAKPAATAGATAPAASGASSASTAGNRTKQQEKMQGCNKAAGEKKLKGDERKAFMKDCLSK